MAMTDPQHRRRRKRRYRVRLRLPCPLERQQGNERGPRAVRKWTVLRCEVLSLAHPYLPRRRRLNRSVGSRPGAHYTVNRSTLSPTALPEFPLLLPFIIRHIAWRFDPLFLNETSLSCTARTTLSCQTHTKSLRTLSRLLQRTHDTCPTTFSMVFSQQFVFGRYLFCRYLRHCFESPFQIERLITLPGT
jgi:hypothetical protein